MEKEQLLLLILQDSKDPNKERPVILVVQLYTHSMNRIQLGKKPVLQH